MTFFFGAEELIAFNAISSAEYFWFIFVLSLVNW